WTTVGNTFIACMLTILGYSINATIVIFDRIREELKLAGKNVDLKEVVNKSITQTITRTLYSSFTTFIMVAALYVFGVASIKEFAMPLMVGIVCGGYSSVCITGALWYLMEKRKYKKQA
ncbi:MAG: protein translocase subunit SecDF, partial [Lachnospiraceae bacterium]|nr:protein translocase subunit SecDF [Lachnospiraceae bacterium]